MLRAGGSAKRPSSTRQAHSSTLLMCFYYIPLTRESQSPAQSQQGCKVSTHLEAQQSHRAKGLQGHCRERVSILHNNQIYHTRSAVRIHPYLPPANSLSFATTGRWEQANGGSMCHLPVKLPQRSQLKSYRDGAERRNLSRGDRSGSS